MRSSSPTWTACDGLTARPPTSMRPASSASFASVLRLARRETLRYLSSLMIFRALPQHVEVFKAAAGERGRASASEPLHRRESLAEFHVRRTQRRFGVNAEPPREIDEREEDIAHFFADVRSFAAFQRRAQLAHLLIDLLDDAVRVWPVEVDGCGLLL